MIGNALVPELAVSDWQISRAFYCDLVGFTVAYERSEGGFSFLTLGDAQLMIDQIGIGRTFEVEDAQGGGVPFGRGLNLQILVPQLVPVLARLAAAGVSLYLPLEEKWYRRGDREVGNRQFIVPDPDGYLLRLYEDLGERSAG